MNYYDDFKGVAGASTILIPAAGVKRLPPNACKFAFLARWSVTNNEAFTTVLAPGEMVEESNLQVFYGFDGVIVDELFPGRRTELLPISNTNQVVVRNPLAGVEVAIYFAWFK